MIRNADDPKIKDAIMAQLAGEVIGHLKSKGLKDGPDFVMKTIPKFQCSTRVIYIDGIHPDKQVVIAFHSIGMNVEYGVSYQGNPPAGEGKVINRRKIESLRYKISSGTEPELTDGSQAKYNELWEEIINEIEGLKS